MYSESLILMLKMERISVLLHSLIFWSYSSRESLAKYGHVSVTTFPLFILEFFRSIYHHHHRCCHWYKVKVKLSLYMPGHALRAASRISRQSAYEVGIILSSKGRPPLPPGDIAE
jgi:hypothetical protein